jgi:hypothetical protein
MANLVLISEILSETAYTDEHIRYLLRKELVKGRKQGGIWLVDLNDLKRYEREMSELGTKKFNPTRGKEEDEGSST